MRTPKAFIKEHRIACRACADRASVDVFATCNHHACLTRRNVALAHCPMVRSKGRAGPARAGECVASNGRPRASTSRARAPRPVSFRKADVKTVHARNQVHVSRGWDASQCASEGESYAPIPTAAPRAGFQRLCRARCRGGKEEIRHGTPVSNLPARTGHRIGRVHELREAGRLQLDRHRVALHRPEAAV